VLKIDNPWDLNLSIAGAIAIKSNKDFVVVIHSLTVPSPITIIESHRDGEAGFCWQDKRFKSKSVDSITRNGLKVQDVSHYNTM
jgi:hypothetical protein